MKKLVILFVTMITLLNAYGQTTVTCDICNGYKALRCNVCQGSGVVNTQVWNPYYGCYQTIQQYCGYCGGRGSVMCGRCNGYGVLVVNEGNHHPSFQGNNRIAVSVNTRKCSGSGGSLCSCTTYKGYRIAGTNKYVGKCTNIVMGHTCGHDPEAHGL